MLFCGCEAEKIIVDNEIYGWLWTELLLPYKELIDLNRNDFDTIEVEDYNVFNNRWDRFYSWYENDFVAVEYKGYTEPRKYYGDQFLKIRQLIRYDFDVLGNLTRISFRNDDYNWSQHKILWDGPRIITPLKDYLENNGYVLESTDDTYTYYSKNGVNVRHQRRGNLDELGWYGEVILIDRP